MKRSVNKAILILGSVLAISGSVAFSTDSLAIDAPPESLLTPPAELTEPVEAKKEAPPASADVKTGEPAAVSVEDAIMENADKLDSISPPAAKDTSTVKNTDARKGAAGATVTDILEEADGMPGQEGYLIVKKDYNSEDFSARLTTALLALSRGRYPAALEIFNALYTTNPDDNRVLMGRAVSLQKMGMNADALSAYEIVLSHDPKNLEALTNMLGILKGQDQAAALEKLRQLQEVYPSNADIAAQLGMSYGTAGDYEKSVKYLDIADSLEPGNLDIMYNRAVAYDRMGNKHQAIDQYRQILSVAGGTVPPRGFPLEVIRKRLLDLQY